MHNQPKLVERLLVSRPDAENPAVARDGILPASFQSIAAQAIRIPLDGVLDDIDVVQAVNDAFVAEVRRDPA
jgi:hypothetical protein